MSAGRDLRTFFLRKWRAKRRIGTQYPNLPIPALIGPTCAGKSSLALQLAAEAPVAIISVDTGAIYRGLDVATAKPDRADRRRVPHYMIDAVNPDETYSAWRFRADLEKCLDDISRQNLCPLLVGGSLFYFLTLLTGLAGSSGHDDVRERIQKLASDRDSASLHAYLRKLNVKAARKVNSRDRFRIIRALERESTAQTGLQPGTKKLALDPCILAPIQRQDLNGAIEKRLSGFIRNGLVDEVRALRRRWNLNSDHPSMRIVAYRQAGEHLDGQYDLATMQQKAAVATRALCKRQYTWMRSGKLGAEWHTDAATLRPRLQQSITDYLAARSDL